MRSPLGISAPEIQDPTIRYRWDDWKTIPESQQVSDLVLDQLNRLSQRAILAFTCATAEWITYRFENLTDTTEAWNYLEAAWAMIIDVRYAGYGSGTWWQEYASEGWDGPVRAVIAESLERLEVATQQLAWKGTDPVRRSGLVCALAEYIMPIREPFVQWRTSVLNRLLKLYPRDRQDVLGDVVPKQALDPSAQFDISQTERLINEMLSSLDFRSNSFLSSPDGMLEPDDMGEHFIGTPYVFDMAADRVLRER